MTKSDHECGVAALVAHGWSEAEAIEGIDALAAMDGRPGHTPLTETKATVFMGVATGDAESKAYLLAEFCNPLARRTIATLITIELSQ